MEVRIPHHTTAKAARSKVESILDEASQKHAHLIQELSHQWAGDTLEFDFKAAGFKVTGSLAVTPNELVIKGKVPLFAKPFESKIVHAIEKEAKKHFKIA